MGPTYMHHCVHRCLIAIRRRGISDHKWIDGYLATNTERLSARSVLRMVIAPLTTNVHISRYAIFISKSIEVYVRNMRKIVSV